MSGPAVFNAIPGVIAGIHGGGFSVSRWPASITGLQAACRERLAAILAATSGKLLPPAAPVMADECGNSLKILIKYCWHE